jgi:hypothetical protein
MTLNTTEEEQGALKLADIIEKTADDPEEAARRIEAKTNSKGVLGTIFGFIRDYKNKAPDQSNEEWLEQQFAKQDAALWKGGEKERAEAAKALVNDIEGYENAKKSLRSHIELGGNRASWLAEQIEIGAANNNINPGEYAREVFEGLNAAREENAEFLLDNAMKKETK